MTGAPDWLLLLWDWDKLKVISKINIGITGIPASMNQKDGNELDVNFQISFNPHEVNYIVVTGPDTYKYYKYEDGAFEADHTQINNKDKDLTTKYSCHAWMQDGRLVVCTEVGEIIVLETDGSYSAFVPDSPVENEFKIEAIVATARGFIIAGDGLIYAFEKSEDPRIPYRLITEPIEVKMDSSDSKSSFGPNVNFSISSMTLSSQEDYIYFVTKNK